MVKRLKVIENERNSVDGRPPKLNHFENDNINQKVNIYKSHEDMLNQNKHTVVKDLQQNKQEMIKRLNQKIDSMFNEDNYNQRQAGIIYLYLRIKITNTFEYINLKYYEY